MSLNMDLPLVIQEDGTRSRFHDPKSLEDGYSFEEIKEAMESEEMITIVRCKDGITMIAFDDGYAMGLGVNEDGTALYRSVGGQSAIVGRIFLCKSEWVQ